MAYYTVGKVNTTNTRVLWLTLTFVVSVHESMYLAPYAARSGLIGELGALFRNGT